MFFCPVVSGSGFYPDFGWPLQSVAWLEGVDGFLVDWEGYGPRAVMRRSVPYGSFLYRELECSQWVARRLLLEGVRRGAVRNLLFACFVFFASSLLALIYCPLAVHDSLT